MRVVHVVQRFHPALGGAETHVRAVAAEQARRGWDVEVCASLAPGAPSEEHVDGVRVTRFAARHWRGDYVLPPWLPMPGLVEHVVAAKPDVIHAHGYRFATIEAGAEAARRLGAPLVVTAHGFHPAQNALAAWSWRRYDAGRGARALRAAARCVAVAEHEVAEYVARGVDPARVDVVPNGLPARAFEPGDGAAFRKAHGLEGPLVLFLARLAPDKGVLDLVRAAAEVPEATFAFCGRDGGEEERARRLAGPNVRVLGAVDDPRDAMAACDVFCVPSHYEGHSIVLLEAMAQGCCIVTTRAGGNPDAIGDAGALVPPRDPAALAASLRRLLADPAERARLGAAAKARAAGLRWENVLDRLEEVYRRARE